MKAYIDKTALIAEIEKELNTTKKYSTEYVNGKKYALKKILSFLDTLEVKEVDSTDAFIEKACNYLFSHMGLFVTFFDDDIVEDIERSEFIKKFRIEMEE